MSELVSVIDIATQCGKRKQTVFKVLRRLGIEPQKRLGPSNRGQLVSYVSAEEARVVVGELRAQGIASSNEQFDEVVADVLLGEQGVFYLLLLEPKHDPGRFKVGFAASLPERLRQLRCSAPLLEVVRTWPCKRLWEKTAIDCVTQRCVRLHTEVFRAQSVQEVAAKCDQFFSLMPASTSGATNDA